MSVARMHVLRPYPNFKLLELPEAERGSAGRIRLNIGNLDERAKHYWAGKTLFDHLEFRKQTDNPHALTFYTWQHCAARDCVMSVYHFGKIIEGIDESLKFCPTLQKMINLQAKRTVRRLFKSYFPFYIDLRDAIAHSAERSHTNKAYEEHSKKGKMDINFDNQIGIITRDDEDRVLIKDNLVGNKFSTMWHGVIFSLEINEHNGRKLDDITDKYWDAFKAIIDPTPQALPIVTFSKRS